MGVEAMLKSVDLVKAARRGIKQDDRRPPRRPLVRHARIIGKLGSNHRSFRLHPRQALDHADGKQLKVFDAKPLPAKTPKVSPQTGESLGGRRRLHRGRANGASRSPACSQPTARRSKAGEWASCDLAVKARFA